MSEKQDFAIVLFNEIFFHSILSCTWLADSPKTICSIKISSFANYKYTLHRFSSLPARYPRRAALSMAENVTKHAERLSEPGCQIHFEFATLGALLPRESSSQERRIPNSSRRARHINGPGSGHQARHRSREFPGNDEVFDVTTGASMPLPSSGGNPNPS